MLRKLVLAAVVISSLLTSANAAWTQTVNPFSSGPRSDVRTISSPDLVLATADAEPPPTLLGKGGFALFDVRRLAFERPAIDAAFSNLNGDYEVLRPHSKTYNCIAWSLGGKPGVG